MDNIEQIIAVGEHFFKTPVVPSKKEIFFHDLPKKEQYWKRKEAIKDIPSFFFDWHRDVEENAKITKYEGKQLVSLSIVDTEKLKWFRDREIDRMLDGIWFFNNGVSTYLTGGHYGVLVWAQMFDCLNEVEQDSPYGSYYQFQRTHAYFIEICKKTTVAKGGDEVKPKKTGITMFQNLLMLIDAITHRSANYAIMSTKEDEATKTNMGYVLYAVRRLPEVLKPEYRNNLSAVYFQDTGKGAKSGTRKNTDKEPLESVIQTVATVWNGFDGTKRRVAHVDEQSKIKLDKNYDLTILHNNAIATVMQGLIRVGYLIYTHYVSDTNDKSFRLAKKIYYESKLRTVNPDTGTTKSGLICLALTVYDGIFGGCDIYGLPVVEKIMKVINAEMEAKKDDPNALRSYRRQFPSTEEDCWSEGAGEASVFDNFRLGNKLHELVNDESISAFSYMDFNFKWSIDPVIDDIKNIYKFPGFPMVISVTDDEKRNGKSAGLWKWYRPEWSPRWFLDKHVNQLLKDKKGRLMPNPGCPFYAAIDPTQYSAKKDVAVASMNSIQVFILPNSDLDGYFDKKVTNKRLMVEYHHRAENPKDTLMHVVQTILYFGCYVLIECNAGWLAARLKEWGLANFLIQLNKETGILEPYNEYGNQKPFTSQRNPNGNNDTIGEYIAAGMMHINDYSHVDNVEFLDSASVITDLMNFEPEDTRQYDSGVCYLIGLLGMNTYLGWRHKQNEKGNRGQDERYKIMACGLLH